MQCVKIKPTRSYLISLVARWQLPEMRLLAVVVEVSERELCSVCGQLHREAVADTVGALPVHKSEALGISRGKHGGDLRMSEKSDLNMCPDIH